MVDSDGSSLFNALAWESKSPRGIFNVGTFISSAKIVGSYQLLILLLLYTLCFGNGG